MNHKIGEKVIKTSRQGGGSYAIIGIVNCNRCGIEIEEREVITPNKQQRKRGSYYSQYSWCPECKLYENNPDTRVLI